MSYEKRTPWVEVCQKAHLCWEKSTAQPSRGVTVPSESRNPATSRVEFDRKAKLLGNSGQLEAESQFRRKVRESQSRRKYDRSMFKSEKAACANYIKVQQHPNVNSNSCAALQGRVRAGCFPSASPALLAASSLCFHNKKKTLEAPPSAGFQWVPPVATQGRKQSRR